MFNNQVYLEKAGTRRRLRGGGGGGGGHTPNPNHTTGARLNVTEAMASGCSFASGCLGYASASGGELKSSLGSTGRAQDRRSRAPADGDDLSSPAMVLAGREEGGVSRSRAVGDGGWSSELESVAEARSLEARPALPDLSERMGQKGGKVCVRVWVCAQGRLPPKTPRPPRPFSSPPPTHRWRTRRTG